MLNNFNDQIWPFYIKNKMMNMYINGLFIMELIALVAQLGERKTEDLKVAGSNPAGGIF